MFILQMATEWLKKNLCLLPSLVSQAVMTSMISCRLLEKGCHSDRRDLWLSCFVVNELFVRIFAHRYHILCISWPGSILISRTLLASLQMLLDDVVWNRSYWGWTISALLVLCYLRRRGNVIIVVCLSAGLCAKYLKKLWTDFGEIFWRGGAWPWDKSIRFR